MRVVHVDYHDVRGYLSDNRMQQSAFMYETICGAAEAGTTGANHSIGTVIQTVDRLGGQRRRSW
jgi:hypothetical protein